VKRTSQIGGVARTVCLALVLWLGTATASRADDPDFISVGLGAFDVFDDQTAAEARLEYRSDKKFWIFKPFSGFMITDDQALYGYLGVLVDVYFGNRWVVTPSFAPGAWKQGDGKDLGHWIEFRSQLEVAYRFDDRSRVAMSISHMSNASIDENNQGEESVMLTYAVPFSRLLGN
jgi:lipid A 3-O-deacylase